MLRRQFFTTATLCGIVGTVGCLSGNNGDETTDTNDSDSESDQETDDEDDEPEHCEIASRDEQGTADPIEESATVDADEVDSAACGTKSAEAALTELDDQLEISIAGEPWVDPQFMQRDGEELAVVSVSTVGSGGEKTICPDPDWDFDKALAVLPRKVTLNVSTATETSECTFETRLQQQELWEG
ncbi:hypothetical protein [Natronolimnobius baerhuensis]|uniref:Uncharacterized protein n=1 Tax=Natronolimnobius baerhuensis TaxID=253108 RepID=A0A202E5P6_9EURY|nr:hypothetical protein [Natronolimnobius baerhuensis]OVE83581.1 hypothetical protein B2G88_14185 [Natronolimnobius baerhuensis]